MKYVKVFCQDNEYISEEWVRKYPSYYEDARETTIELHDDLLTTSSLLELLKEEDDALFRLKCLTERIIDGSFVAIDEDEYNKALCRYYDARNAIRQRVGPVEVEY